MLIQTFTIVLNYVKKWFIANDNGCIEVLIAIFKVMVIRMNENVLNYKKESAKLFERWKNTELHKENVFIKDGIVCPETWFNSDKRPLYLLKEAYGGNDDWNLIDDYLTKNDNINSVTWRRVSLWSKGILKTSKDHLEVFNPEDEELHKFNNKYLRNIAVINVKKSGGQKSSSYDEIIEYAKKDKECLLKQLNICDPNIIICGYTISALKEILGYDIKAVNNNHLYYFSELNGHSLIILDYWHPANQFPDIMNYYGLMHVYQQALIINR